MSKVSVSQTANSRSLMATGVAAVLMLVPSFTLGFGALSHQGGKSVLLLVGAGTTLVAALVLFRYVANRPLQSPLACLPCPIGAAFLWQAHPNPQHPFGVFAMGLLILAPVCFFAIQAVVATGAPALRQARKLVEELKNRSHWPEDLHECRSLAEILPLREALRTEAAPVMPLLSNPRPQVRVAALATLEYRKRWRTGQPDQILELALADPEPEVARGRDHGPGKCSAASVARGNVRLPARSHAPGPPCRGGIVVVGLRTPLDLGPPCGS